MNKVGVMPSVAQAVLSAKTVKPTKASASIVKAGAATFKAAAKAASPTAAKASQSASAVQVTATTAAVGSKTAVASTAGATFSLQAMMAALPSAGGSKGLSTAVQPATSILSQVSPGLTSVAASLAVSGASTTSKSSVASAVNISQEVRDFIAWQDAQPNLFGGGTVGDMWKGDNVSVERVAQAQAMISREAHRLEVRNRYGISAGDLFAWSNFSASSTALT
jgi:hypothetical protein